MRSISQQRWKKVEEHNDIVTNVTSCAREQKQSNNIGQKKKTIQNLTKKLQDYEPFIEKTDAVKRDYPFIHYMFQTVVEKVQRTGKFINGIRYSLCIIPYILILSLFGKKLAKFLHVVLGIPTWKTIISWKKNILTNTKFALMAKKHRSMIY